MKILLILLLLVSLGFAQVPIFGTTAAPLDTASLTDATAITSRLIIYNAKPEGVGTLFMAGDTVSGDPIGVVGEYRFYYGVNQFNKAMYGPWRTIADSVLVKADIYASGTITGSDAVGRETNLAEETEWSLSTGIQFRFTGAGTQVTLLLGRFDYF